MACAKRTVSRRGRARLRRSNAGRRGSVLAHHAEALSNCWHRYSAQSGFIVGTVDPFFRENRPASFA